MKLFWKDRRLIVIALAAPGIIYAPSIPALYLFGQDGIALAGIYFSTLFAPILISFLLHWLCNRTGLSRRTAGWAALFGIWYLGFYWTLLLAALGGGSTENEFMFGLLGFVLAPILVFMFSTYTGHLGAMLTTTAAVLIFMFFKARIVSPREKAPVTPE